MTDTTWLDATAQAELVRTGAASPSELIDDAIARVEKLNPELNAVIHERFEKARAEAAGPLPDGPFRGVPFVVKDLTAGEAGQPFHGGIKAAKEAGVRADHDTMLIERFRAAGLVCVGRTNTPEIGLVPTTEPAAYGPARNPWNTRHSTGGSSGGSAAAVASGMTAIGHANDGGGSIRIPASECGLVGLKPSRGRVPLLPDDIESWAGLVAELAVTRSVRDTATILDAVSAPHTGALHTPPAPPDGSFLAAVSREPRQLRIGVLVDSPDGATPTHPECAEAARATAMALSQLGHTVEDAAPPGLVNAELITSFLPCFGSWTAAELDHWGARVGRPLSADDVEPGTWAIAEIGRGTTAVQYLAGLGQLQKYSAQIQQWWADGWDVLITPTIPEPPPELGQFTATADNPLAGVFRAAGIVPYTAPFNITGQPAISLPMAQSASGLPMGVQLVGAYGREDVLLSVAAQLEAARPWTDRRPPVSA